MTLYETWQDQQSLPHRHVFESGICTRYVCLPKETPKKYWCEAQLEHGYSEDFCVDDNGQFSCYFEQFNDLETSRCERKTDREIIEQYDWLVLECERCTNNFKAPWQDQWHEDPNSKILCPGCEQTRKELETHGTEVEEQ